MHRVWPLIALSVALLTGGCSSLETIALSDDAWAVSDIPIPVPAPRAAVASAQSEVATPVVRPQEPTDDKTIPPHPVARPEIIRGLLDEPGPAAATAVAALTRRIHDIGDIAISSANAAEAQEALAPRFEEASSATPEAAALSPAPPPSIDPEAVERRDVKVIEGCINDVFRTCPRTPAQFTAALPAATSNNAIFSASIDLMRVPSLDARTALWVLIGFAALLGLFISARRSAG